MDKERELTDREELRRRMEETRQSMSETVGEIKQELVEAFEWRTYLRRYPGAFLVGAALTGVLLGRALKPDEDERGRGEYRTGDFGEGEGDHYTRPRSTSYRSETGERSESLVRKAGEVIAATVLAQIAPIVSTTLRKAFGLDAGRRSEPTTPGSSWTH